MEDLIGAAFDNGFPSSHGLSSLTGQQAPPNPHWIGTAANALNSINPDGSPTQSYQLPYGYRYPQLCHYPMFPLYGPADSVAFAKAQQRKQQKLARLIPEPELGDKLKIAALHLATGVNMNTDRKLKNGLVKFGAAGIQKTMDQNKVCVLTRWAVSPSTSRVTWFVDVLEYRCVEGWKGNTVLLKTSANAPPIKLLKKCIVKNLKPTRTWTKNFNTKEVDSVMMIGENKVETEMEIVARDERILSGVEGMEVKKRFEYEWWIPVL